MDRHTFAKGRRLQVLEALRSSPSPLSIVEVAERLGVHPNTVRFHLDALVGSGQVERMNGPADRPGRPPLRFQHRRGMDPAGPENYRLVAEALLAVVAAGPDPAESARQAGRRWGKSCGEQSLIRRPVSRRAATGHLVAVLDDLGFTPERNRRKAGEVRLRHCPFLGLVDDYGPQICSLHLGVMQGLLEATGAVVTADRLEPFVEPDLCVAHLASVTTPKAEGADKPGKGVSR